MCLRQAPAAAVGRQRLHYRTQRDCAWEVLYFKVLARKLSRQVLHQNTAPLQMTLKPLHLRHAGTRGLAAASLHDRPHALHFVRPWPHLT